MMNKLDAKMLCLDRLFFLLALVVAIVNAIAGGTHPELLLLAFSPVVVTSGYLMLRTWKLSHNR